MTQSPEQIAISMLFEENGWEENDNTLQQFSVMMEAFGLFVERDTHHKSLWKEYGPEDTALHVKSKAARFNVDPATHQDDGLDLINYTVFALRHQRGMV